MKKIFIFLLFFFITFLNVYAEEYVTGIKIDDVDFAEFDPSITEYTIQRDSNVDKIKIAYIYDHDPVTGYTGQGSQGNLDLKYGNNVFTFKLIKDDKVVKEYKITVIRNDNRSNDNSLASLSVGGSKVVLGNENEYTVDVDSKLIGITITAKTTSDKASFIDGYGPRTIAADSKTCEIWVKAENEEIRKYKINITKSNAKSNDASLKNLSIDRINFDFKSTTFEYKIKATSDISKIKVTAVPTSDKASLEYKEEHTLNTGENIIEIKVTAEDGTKKTYKLIITREEELPLVKDIKIKDVEFSFDSTKYSYTIETKLTTLDFDVSLNKDTAKVEITGNENLQNKSIITLEVKDEDKSIIYKFQILNGNEDLGVVEPINTKLSFFEKYEMIIGLAVFGIGLFSLLAVILLKPKSKIM